MTRHWFEARKIRKCLPVNTKTFISAMTACNCEPSLTTNNHVGPSSVMKLPPGLMMSDSLRRAADDVYKIPLVPLNVGFGVVKELADKSLTLRQVVKREAKKQGDCTVTLVFAIRRPGCGACREHGQQLADFAMKNPKVAVIGVVKEAGVDDESLIKFHTHYFRKLPIYKDDKWMTYKALGGRKITIRGLINGFLASRKRLAEKDIETKLGSGDGWMQGGVLVFDRRGTLRYAYEEDYGSEIDTDSLTRVVAAAQSRLDVEDETSGSFSESL